MLEGNLPQDCAFGFAHTGRPAGLGVVVVPAVLAQCRAVPEGSENRSLTRYGGLVMTKIERGASRGC